MKLISVIGTINNVPQEIHSFAEFDECLEFQIVEQANEAFKKIALRLASAHDVEDFEDDNGSMEGFIEAGSFEVSNASVVILISEI